MAEAKPTTREELVARAMLLGMSGPYTYRYLGEMEMFVFRKKTGVSNYVGMALFSYVDALTLKPIPDMQDRPEIDDT